MNQLHRLKAVHSRHEDIDDEQVEASRFEELETGETVIDSFDRMCCALKQQLDRGQDRSVVIDDENARNEFPLPWIFPGRISFESRLHASQFRPRPKHAWVITLGSAQPDLQRNLVKS